MLRYLLKHLSDPAAYLSVQAQSTLENTAVNTDLHIALNNSVYPSGMIHAQVQVRESLQIRDSAAVGHQKILLSLKKNTRKQIFFKRKHIRISASNKPTLAALVLCCCLFHPNPAKTLSENQHRLRIFFIY